MADDNNNSNNNSRYVKVFIEPNVVPPLQISKRKVVKKCSNMGDQGYDRFTGNTLCKTNQCKQK